MNKDERTILVIGCGVSSHTKVLVEALSMKYLPVIHMPKEHPQDLLDFLKYNPEERLQEVLLSTQRLERLGVQLEEPIEIPVATLCDPLEHHMGKGDPNGLRQKFNRNNRRW